MSLVISCACLLTLIIISCVILDSNKVNCKYEKGMHIKFKADYIDYEFNCEYINKTNSLITYTKTYDDYSKVPWNTHYLMNSLIKIGIPIISALIFFTIYMILPGLCLLKLHTKFSWIKISGLSIQYGVICFGGPIAIVILALLVIIIAAVLIPILIVLCVVCSPLIVLFGVVYCMVNTFTIKKQTLCIVR